MAKFYLNDRGSLIKIEGHRGFSFASGQWREAGHLPAAVTGRGGDCYDKISEEEARKRFPQAF